MEVEAQAKENYSAAVVVCVTESHEAPTVWCSTLAVCWWLALVGDEFSEWVWPAGSRPRIIMAFLQDIKTAKGRSGLKKVDTTVTTASGRRVRIWGGIGTRAVYSSYDTCSSQRYGLIPVM